MIIQDIQPRTGLDRMFYHSMAELDRLLKPRVTKIPVFYIDEHHVVDNTDWSDGEESIVGPRYCWQCGQEETKLTPECRRKI